MRWFKALMPKEHSFFELFARHSRTLVDGAEALQGMLRGGAEIEFYCDKISQYENEADNITREVMMAIRRSFITPFDRGDIKNLIAAMDDAIDQMQQTAMAIDLYEVKEFEQEMKDIAAIIVDAARVIAEALPLLRNIGDNAARLHELTERLVKMEGQSDQIHAAGLKTAFKTYGEANTLRFIVSREIYSHLERVVDRFEDVANEIDGLVIDHA